MSQKRTSMKAQKVLAIRADNWNDAVQIGRRLFAHVFRGHADEKWTLSTTLERTADRYNFPKSFLKNREDAILNHFQRRAHHFIASPPPFESRLEWLSILQHHGAPTRLLDFTHSFYVAAFFAIEAATTDAALWAVDLFASHSHIEWPWKGDETIIDRQRKSREVVEDNISNYTPHKSAMGVEPERLNMRMSAQQGLFLVPGDLSCSFMDNLLATIDCSKKEFQDQLRDVVPANRVISSLPDANGIDAGLVKLIMPISLHNRAIGELHTMNIHAASLFPDLDGFARSLAIYLRDAE